MLPRFQRGSTSSILPPSVGSLLMVIRRQNALQPALMQLKQSSMPDRRRSYLGCVLQGPPSAK